MELHLSYEGDVVAPLAIGSIDGFVFELEVHPATLVLRSRLANLLVLDGGLEEGNPNRTMVTMREGVAKSLVEVTFKWVGVADRGV